MYVYIIKMSCEDSTCYSNKEPMQSCDKLWGSSHGCVDNNHYCCKSTTPSSPSLGCESVCTTSSSNLMSTDSIPTIKDISISGNNLMINYSGASAQTKGVNRWPADYGSKVMWLYGCPGAQGLACVPLKYQDPSGAVNGDFIKKVISKKVNYISMICNNKFVKWDDLGVIVPNEPGSTYGLTSYPSSFGTPSPSQSGQHQTNILFSKAQLKELHEYGVTIVLSIGSWMSDFVRDQVWTDDEMDKYVARFECIRCSLGGYLDGIDFDIEGACDGTCLQEGCDCGWDGGCKGDGYQEDNKMMTEKGGKKCYSLLTKATVDTMNGIAARMKAKGYVVSIVPPTNTLFSPDKAANNGQNHLVKYGLDFTNIDGIMFQFYTGFDAGICQKGNDRWGNCPQTNIEDLTTINLDYLVQKSTGTTGIDTSYKSLPIYSNYPNRNPVHCPRAPDCPDWAYKGEAPFQTQSNYFSNLVKGVTGMKWSQFVFGLEFFFNQSQWGAFASPSLFYGLNDKIESDNTGKQLAGVGGWTIAGTFGEYNHPTPSPSLSAECNRSGFTNNSPGLTKEDKNNDNMWCIGPYHEHFVDEIVQCWGTWGNEKIANIQSSKICTELKAQPYCAYKDTQNGVVQCSDTSNDEVQYPTVPQDWPPKYILQ
jgi:hypothetical protein